MKKIFFYFAVFSEQDRTREVGETRKSAPNPIRDPLLWRSSEGNRGLVHFQLITTCPCVFNCASELPIPTTGRMSDTPNLSEVATRERSNQPSVLVLDNSDAFAFDYANLSYIHVRGEIHL